MKELIERLRDDRLGMLQGLGAEAADALERLTADCDAYISLYESAHAMRGDAEVEALNAEAERDDLGDDLAQAKRYIETLKAERDAWEKNCNEQIDLLNFTANERDALRADAMRYRWLASDDRTQVDWDRMLIAFLSSRLAAAIDAAIAGETK